ncbi:MAG: hypothetical protein ACP5I7_04260 [Sulfolobales archaeon]
MGKSTIALVNMIFGAYNFIVLSHPDDWRIAPSSYSSEIFESISQNNVRWVRRGLAEHNIYTNKEIVGLRIEIWGGRKESREIKSLKKLTRLSTTAVVNGHLAEIYLGEERRSNQLFKRLSIYFYCDKTDRTILLEFIGKTDINRILEHIKDSQCHI